MPTEKTVNDYFIVPEFNSEQIFYNEDGHRISSKEEYDEFLERIFSGIQEWNKQAVEMYGEHILDVVGDSALHRHVLTWANGPGILNYLFCLPADRISFWSIGRTWVQNTSDSPFLARLPAITLGTLAIWFKTVFTDNPAAPTNWISMFPQILKRLIIGAEIEVGDGMRHAGTLGAWDKETGKFDLNFWNKICEKNFDITQQVKPTEIDRETISANLKEESCPFVTKGEWFFMFNTLKEQGSVAPDSLFKSMVEGGATNGHYYKPKPQ